MDSAFSFCERILRFCDCRSHPLWRLENSLFSLARELDGGHEFDFMWCDVSIHAISSQTDRILQRNTAFFSSAHRHWTAARHFGDTTTWDHYTWQHSGVLPVLLCSLKEQKRPFRRLKEQRCSLVSILSDANHGRTTGCVFVILDVLYPGLKGQAIRIQARISRHKLRTTQRDWCRRVHLSNFVAAVLFAA